MNENKARSQAIIQWLQNHPLISIAPLCEAVGYDSASMRKALKGQRDIPEMWLNGFEVALTYYGFQLL